MFGELFHDFYSKSHICVLKFSNDTGRRREEIPTFEGKALGPDCVFRFIPTVGTIQNPAYPLSTQEAFSKLMIGKFNNVKPNPGRRIDKHVLSRVSVSLEEYHEQLETDIVRVFRHSVPNQKILLLASGNDVLHPCIRAFMHGPERVPLHQSENITSGIFHNYPAVEDRKLKVVIFSNSLDLRPLYEEFKIQSGCALRKYLVDHPDDTLDIVYFGVDRNFASKQELDFVYSVKSPKLQITIIYSDEITKSSEHILDQMKATLTTTENTNLMVLFNVEVLNVSKFNKVFIFHRNEQDKPEKSPHCQTCSGVHEVCG